MGQCASLPAAADLSYAALEAIGRRHGDSFYLVDLDAFEANYREFLEAFRCRYPRTNIAYSYKANYTPELCRRIDRLGGYAEVVSRLEYELATRLGVPPQRILFNGPYKSADDVETTLTRGATVNVDWPYQAALVEEVARRHPDVRLRVGVRGTFDAGCDRPSRFGFDAEEELGPLMRRLRVIGGVEVAGLHCHFLTRHRSPADYRRIARRMLELASLHFGRPGPAFLDVGGGFFSRMPEPLREQFGMPVPSFEEYGEAVAGQFAARYPAGDGPELILEPGLALTADVAKFVARVVDARRLRGRNLALVAGSVYNVKPTLSPKNLPLEVVPCAEAEAPGVEGTVDLVGHTCLEHDVLYRGYQGRIAAGDYVVFGNVGAYTNVLKPPFIHGAPPMLGLSSAADRPIVLQRKEQPDDVLRTYTF